MPVCCTPRPVPRVMAPVPASMLPPPATSKLPAPEAISDTLPSGPVDSDDARMVPLLLMSRSKMPCAARACSWIAPPGALRVPELSTASVARLSCSGLSISTPKPPLSNVSVAASAPARVMLPAVAVMVPLLATRPPISVADPAAALMVPLLETSATVLPPASKT